MAATGAALDQTLLPAETPRLARDHGLLRGIGTAEMAASIVNGVVGAGIFTLPASMALEAGASAAWAYAACAIAMAAVVICFADAGARVPTSGGAYGTVEAAFGPGAGFVTGILLILSCLLASGGVTAALAGMAASLVPALGTPIGHVGSVAVIMGVIAALNLSGVRTTARLIGGATAFKLLPLLLFLALALYAATIGHGPAPLPLGPARPGGIARAVVLALFAFCGMETPLGASGEIRDPARTLPRALFLAMGFVLLLYLAVQAAASFLLGADLAHSAAPLADAAGRVSHAGRAVLLAGAGVSMFSWLATDTLGSSRMIFALARDGRAPGFLAVLNPRTRVPARAVVIYTSAAAVLAASGSFLTLVVASALNSAAVYVLACAAAVVLHRRRVLTAGPGFTMPGLPLIALFGMLAMLAVIASAARGEILGLLATVAFSVIAFALMRRRA